MGGEPDVLNVVREGVAPGRCALLEVASTPGVTASAIAGRLDWPEAWVHRELRRALFEARVALDASSAGPPR